MIDLRFDIFPWILSHTHHIDLRIEVTDITDDRFVLHTDHMIVSDDIFIPCRSDEYISDLTGFFHRDDTIPFHRSLQGTDRVDLRDRDSSTHPTKCIRTSFPDITISAHDDDLPSDHHISRTLDPIEDRFTTSVEIIKF